MSMIGNFVRISPTQLEDLLKEPERVPGFLSDEEYRTDPAAEHLDIDKTWQIIHFLLAGDPWQGEYPFSAVVLGGAELGAEDVGYGPARYLHPGEVKQIAVALDGVSEATLWARFDAKRVADADIYPQAWSESDSEYVLSNFTALKQLYAAAAKSGQAMLQFLN